MTSAMVPCEKPCSLSEAKASSRFGPIVPCVFASASVWHEPHFSVKIFLPWLGSPDVTRPTAPQPADMNAAARTAARATEVRRPTQYTYDDGWETPSSFETASSRVS